MRPSSAFLAYCTTCHVQAELCVWQKYEKVKSFRGWNFRGLYTECVKKRSELGQGNIFLSIEGFTTKKKHTVVPPITRSPDSVGSDNEVLEND